MLCEDALEGRLQATPQRGQRALFGTVSRFDQDRRKGRSGRLRGSQHGRHAIPAGEPVGMAEGERQLPGKRQRNKSNCTVEDVEPVYVLQIDANLARVKRTDGSAVDTDVVEPGHDFA